MKRILIFEANLDQAIALSKFIRKYSDYYVVGVVQSSSHFVFDYKKHYDKIIKIDDISKISLSDYDYVLPTGAQSTYSIISRYKELKYSNGITFNEDNLIAFDKIRMLRIAKSVGIPIPKTYETITEIDSFPIFYKEKFEKGGGTRGIAKNKDELPHRGVLIYQEYIESVPTYGVGFLAKDGRILTQTQYKEVISYPPEGGSAVVIEQFYDKRLSKYTQKLIRAMNYNGWGLVEFKYCNKRKDFVFMELNAKFWASVEFSLSNNPLFLKYLLDVAYCPVRIKKMVFIDRFLQYDFSTMARTLKYLKGGKFVSEHSVALQLTKKFIPKPVKALLLSNIVSKGHGEKT